MVNAKDPYYKRVEGIGFANKCKSDDDCKVGGCSGEVCSADDVQTPCDVIESPAAGGTCGCVAQNCVWYEIRGASGARQEKELAARMEDFAKRACACADAACAEKVNEEFVSWAADRTDARAGDAERARVQAARTRLADCIAKHDEDLPAQGQKCGAADKCREGLTCLKYYGVAGPSGPESSSCEIRCGKGGSCPKGQRCITIADGPGRVCR
jgi:eight-cysteine-cluster-containing protein